MLTKKKKSQFGLDKLNLPIDLVLSTDAHMNPGIAGLRFHEHEVGTYHLLVSSHL
jgi:hypothetical protein